MAIVERARGRRVQLGEVVVSHILTELPEYANGRSEGELHDIQAGIGQSVDFCLLTLQRGVGVQEHERDVLRCTGAQRARQGIPRQAMEGSVKIAVRVGRRFLMTCTDVGDDPRALMAAFQDVTELLDRFEDEACSALGEGHDEAWRQVLSAADRGEAVLVDRLLERRFDDPEEVLSHAAEIGLNRHHGAHVGVASSISPVDVARLRATAEDVRSVGAVALGPVRVGQPVHLPFVVQPRSPAHWLQLVAHLAQAGARNHTTVVWSETAATLTTLSPAYRSLCDALPFLAAATIRPGGVPSVLPRFHRAMCVGTPVDRMRLVDEVLQPLMSLPGRDRQELLEVLDALYETGGSASALARHLHFHKNTVANRIRRVHELTGLDVRRPPEWLVLEMLLRMRNVTDASLGSGPEWRDGEAGRPSLATGSGHADAGQQRALEAGA